MVLKNLGLEEHGTWFYAGFTGNELERLIREKGIRADFIPVKEDDKDQCKNAFRRGE